MKELGRETEREREREVERKRVRGGRGKWEREYPPPSTKPHSLVNVTVFFWFKNYYTCQPRLPATSFNLKMVM